MPEQTMSSSQPETSRPSLSSDQALHIAAVGLDWEYTQDFVSLLASFPQEAGISFIVTTRMTADQQEKLIAGLEKQSRFSVISVNDQQSIDPDAVYLPTSGHTLMLGRHSICVSATTESDPASALFDPLFTSIADVCQDKALAVSMFEIRQDGLSGLQAVKEQGGIVLMERRIFEKDLPSPESRIVGRLVDRVGDPEELCKAILACTVYRDSAYSQLIRTDEELNQVLSIVQAHTLYDFGAYKPKTMIRRIERRMGLLRITQTSAYLDYLKKNRSEVDALYQDLLIGVTSFFRENKVWEKLKNEILLDLVHGNKIELPVRIWVPGCSTGEEAYTIAILLHELFTAANQPFSAQIFATDIDEEAVKFARRGVYPDIITDQISRDRLRQYFVKDEAGYRIIREIRESVIFAIQNLIGDAPFSNLHLISCRNLLIYLDAGIQKRVIELFHFALKKDGFLVLGNSETIGSNEHLFETESKELRIFRSIGTHRQDRLKIPILNNSTRTQPEPKHYQLISKKKNMASLLQHQLIKRFAPAAVLINKKYEIIQFHGATGDYLDLPAGDAVFDLVSMAKEGLKLKLRASIHKAIKNCENKVVTEARVKRNKRFFPVKITIRPVVEADIPDGLYMVTFEDVTLQNLNKSLPENREGDDQLVKQLESELMATREDLQNTIEELETSNEDLKASNEEIMSMNEELQSSNEELETSKEELQSLNEELNTVNAQLQEKVKELEEINNDLINLINSTEVATIFLNRDLVIRRFTPAAKQLFNLISSDIGRPIVDLTQRFNDSELHGDTQKALKQLQPLTKDVETEDGRWYIRRILPFRTQDNRIEGLVLTFSDVSELKQSINAHRQSEERYRLLFEHAPVSIMVFQKGYVVEANDAAVAMFRLSSSKELTDTPVKQWLDPHHQQSSDQPISIFDEEKLYSHKRIRFQRKDGSLIETLGSSIPINWQEKKATLNVSYDITQVIKAEEDREKILNSVVSGMYIHDFSTGHNIYINPEYTKITGWSLEEVNGLKNGFMDLVHPEDQDIAREHLEKVASDTDDTPLSFEYRLRSKQGDWIWCLSYDTPYERDANGNVTRYIGSFIDITDRVNTEIALHDAYIQTFNILESISDGFFTLNNKFEVTYFNQAAETLLGRSNDAVVGKHLLEAFPEARGSVFEEKYRYALTEKKNTSFETYFDRPPFRNWYKVTVYPFKEGISVYFQITTDKKNYEDLIKSYFDQSLVMLFIIDLKTKQLIQVNREVTYRTGMSEEQLLSQPFFTLFHPDDRDAMFQAIDRLINGHPLLKVHNRIQTASGEIRHVEWTANADSERRLAYAMAIDISEQLQTAEELKESEVRFRLAFENANVGVCLIDLEGVLLKVNEEMCRMFGYAKSEMEGKNVNQFTHPDDLSVSPNQFRRAISGETDHLEFEKQYIHKNGHLIWGQISSTIIKDREGNGLYFIAHVQDITEYKNAENRLKQSLSEKEVLLQEIHHRVKNNMSVISSLLRLQAASEKNERVSAILKECEDRVYTMSVVHETLYRSESLSEISFKTYLSKISQSLFHSYLSQPGKIHLEVSCDEIMLNIEKASPLGLIINELVSNALKHAFPGEKRGKVSIKASTTGKKTIEIIVQDDGVGLPESFDWQNASSLGLQLINTLVVDQLDGTIDVAVDQGTAFKVSLAI